VICCPKSTLWETENVNNKEWLKCAVKQRLLDQFVQNWQISLSDSSKALNYKIFKTKFEFEENLACLPLKSLAQYEIVLTFISISIGYQPSSP
jgi:hypothetical protein